MSVNSKQSHNNMIFNLIVVLTVLVQETFGQSILLTLGHNQHNHFFAEDNLQGATLNYTDTVLPNEDLDAREQFDDSNTTIIVIKSSINNDKSPTELSKTAMDIITVVWYVATFLALAAFFLLMTCSDRRCAENRRNAMDTGTPPIAPPTPTPSYSEFAPPSYETVIKMQHDSRLSVFVIPFAPTPLDGGGQANKNFTTNERTNGNNTTTSAQTPTTPAINFYTVNELEKFGC